MKIAEVIDTKYSISDKEQPWIDGEEVPDKKIGQGSVSFAVDPDDAEQGQDQVIVKRLRSPLTTKQLKRDGKHRWFEAIQPLIKEGNPYVPRVYEIKLNKVNKPGENEQYYTPHYRVERLINPMSVFITTHSDVGGKRSMDLDVIYKMASQISEFLAKKLEEYVEENPKEINNFFGHYTAWKMLLEYIKDYIVEGEMYEGVDPEFVKVAILLKQLLKERHTALDFGINNGSNFLIRTGIGGPRIVVYDPII